MVEQQSIFPEMPRYEPERRSRSVVNRAIRITLDILNFMDETGMVQAEVRKHMRDAKSFARSRGNDVNDTIAYLRQVIARRQCSPGTVLYLNHLIDNLAMIETRFRADRILGDDEADLKNHDLIDGL